MRDFNPADWYWLADDGRLYASARQEVVTKDDPAFVAFISPSNNGFATPWPRDDTGAQTNAALDAVLHAYSIPGPGGVPVPTQVSSAQAKIQLSRSPGASKGRSLLDDVTEKVQGSGGETKIWFDEARTWERSNPYVASLGQALGLKSADIDALFFAAAQIAA